MEKITLEITEKWLHDHLYEIRGQKVLIDSDLASIYGYETKAFNRQVKNNRNRFSGDEFMFQLTKEEYDEVLRCRNSTSNMTAGRGGRTYMPYAFTEQGTYMLATVLKGELAARQSRSLILLFKSMKDFIHSTDQYRLFDQFNQYGSISAPDVHSVSIESRIYRLESEREYGLCCLPEIFGNYPDWLLMIIKSNTDITS